MLQGMVRDATHPPEQILAAAADVFSKVGFADARMEDVAARAGISKGAIYLYRVAA
jgi:AcrR family transcriptional regulator